MADLKEESNGLGDLKIFKNVCKKLIMVCILPLIASLTEEGHQTQLIITQICQKKQVLAKWWGTYIGILEEVYEEKKGKEGWNNNKEIWLPKNEFELWEKTWKLMDAEQLWQIYY